MYKIVVTTPAGDFTFDKVYSSVSEANEYIETLYKHFDETASFKVVLADLSEMKHKLIKVSKDNEEPFDIINLIEPELDNRTLDEKLNSLEFEQALEQNDFSSVNKIFNNTPSGNSLADTGRFPQ
jgi:hypothetical protein